MIGTAESMALRRINRTEWEKEIDDFVDGNFNEEHRQAEELDHTMDTKNTDDRVISYVSGYVVRKMLRFNKCNNCRSTLQMAKAVGGRHSLTSMRSFGYLVYSSDAVFNLVKQLENIFVETISKKQVSRRIMFYVAYELKRIRKVSNVGCSDHSKSLTKEFIKSFYLMRGKMMCQKHNEIISEQRKITKHKRKLSKNARRKKSNKENCISEELSY